MEGPRAQAPHLVAATVVKAGRLGVGVPREVPDRAEVHPAIGATRKGETGLLVRASARFVEAQRLAEAKEWTRLPAEWLIPPERMARAALQKPLSVASNTVTDGPHTVTSGPDTIANFGTRP